MRRRSSSSGRKGDCNAILPTLPGASVDLVVTDPPYLLRYRDRSGRTIAGDDDSATVLASFPELYRVLKPNSFCVSIYGWNTVDLFISAWKKRRLCACRACRLAQGLRLARWLSERLP